jgi:hypothetical protein
MNISSPPTHEKDESDEITPSQNTVPSSDSFTSCVSSVCRQQPRGVSSKGKMELLPKEIEMKIPKLYSQEQADDPTVISGAKNQEWLPKPRRIGTRLAAGFVRCGSFSLPRNSLK